MTIGLAGGAVHYGKLPLANLQTESRGRLCDGVIHESGT